jgi:hypothetical protein
VTTVKLKLWKYNMDNNPLYKHAFTIMERGIQKLGFPVLDMTILTERTLARMHTPGEALQNQADFSHLDGMLGIFQPIDSSLAATSQTDMSMFQIGSVVLRDAGRLAVRPLTTTGNAQDDVGGQC